MNPIWSILTATRLNLSYLPFLEYKNYLSMREQYQTPRLIVEYSKYTNYYPIKTLVLLKQRQARLFEHLIWLRPNISPLCITLTHKRRQHYPVQINVHPLNLLLKPFVLLRFLKAPKVAESESHQRLILGHFDPRLDFAKAFFLQTLNFINQLSPQSRDVSWSPVPKQEQILTLDFFLSLQSFQKSLECIQRGGIKQNQLQILDHLVGQRLVKAVVSKRLD